jgi:NAD(P)-dependent dehydrogenase (short-subunit alcohol dehydrogenase family)
MDDSTGTAPRHGLRKSPDPAGEKGLDGGPGRQSQSWPGRDSELQPRADHGEESYQGAGKLTGRRALITGGDSGIGRAVAIAFAREGADVAIAYYDEDDDAEETLRWVREAGRRGVGIPGDLSEHEVCVATVKRAVEELGGLDILVNNAAYQMEVDSLSDISPEQLEVTFRTNIFAYIWMAQEALKHMPDGGVILNTGSVTALEGHASLVDYACTKGAIHVFTKSLAMQLADRRIRVNCVAPGPVWTPLIPATLDEDHVAEFGADTHWGRAAQPAEIAPSFVFLASADGRYYSGEVFAPTGKGTSR